MPGVSIVTAAFNPGQFLNATIESVATQSYSDWEMIVVDNGSTDETASVVHEINLANMPVHYLSQPTGGKSAGLNQALKRARGDVLLFTDDDVRVPGDWIEKMCGLLLKGKTDAVVGTIRMAPHLRRPWMCADHYLCLACNEGIGLDHPSPDLVGANMAFTRHAVDLVGGFDNELGPGRGTGGEDTLLSWKMKAAGLRIMRVANAVVEHHFDPARLTRKSFIQAAIKAGWNSAYLAHHWLHNTPKHLQFAIARARLRLWYYRVRRWREWAGMREGITMWEKGMIHELAVLRELKAMAGDKPIYGKTLQPTDEGSKSGLACATPSAGK